MHDARDGDEEIRRHQDCQQDHSDQGQHRRTLEVHGRSMISFGGGRKGRIDSTAECLQDP